MRVTVRFFAAVRELSGTDEARLDLPAGATVADAENAVRKVLPATAELMAASAFAVNQSFARRDAVLSDGDELAVIPPVSGG